MMRQGKRDEDADLGLVNLDRVQVFQEGTSVRLDTGEKEGM